MPYQSLAQERYFNANRSNLESQGVNVDEWNQASKGLRLPSQVGERKQRRRPLHLSGALEALRSQMPK
jgi:hypothetical protein